MINARSETAATKPAFRDPLTNRRCLVPADGFYEWQRKGKAKQPFCFEVNDGELFAFAGLWDRWKDPSGQWIKSCSILTTTPNAVTSAVHDRMPVILDPDNYDLWLDPGMTNVEAVSEMLKPFDARLMRCYPVSTRINHVANDDAECSAPVELTETQAGLFWIDHFALGVNRSPHAGHFIRSKSIRCTSAGVMTFSHFGQYRIERRLHLFEIYLFRDLSFYGLSSSHCERLMQSVVLTNHVSSTPEQFGYPARGLFAVLMRSAASIACSGEYFIFWTRCCTLLSKHSWQPARIASFCLM